MDRRSWPWKKKSSDKAAAEKAVAAIESAGSSLPVASQGNQENYKKPNYVQISVESYSHLTGLENQVKTYEEQVQTLEDEIKELNEKLSAAQTEITAKETMVKQHAKVAEEAVSGWEKAEAEALSLKNHLESVTLQKLTAEDRSSHLDGALKECMRQIRNLKEEHEQKLHDVVLSKTKQWERIKLEFETKIGNLDQELRRSAADNAALSRSLQDRSNMIIKMSEEKSQAEAEIEQLKSNVESCERDINSLKYELHIAAKELEIRNEEKNMSVRSAEAINRQHLEGVKKIAKLEAECQRLRGLVRKKLPGPAALAQMKLEVENLGRDYGESRLRRSPVKPSSPSMSPLPEFSLEGVQKFQKDNEFLTERLLAMEEETKMLKEALAKRNSELQASRKICAKTASKLQGLEAELQTNGQQKSSLISHAHSLTSMSEDGNDDTVSCAESWVTGLISEKSNQAANAKHLELMDDFLEMEKLACLPNDSNGAISISDNSSPKKISDFVNQDADSGVTTGKDPHPEQQHDPDQLANQECSNMEMSPNSKSATDEPPLTKLHTRISMVFESISKESNMGKIVEDIKCILQDAHVTLHQQSASCIFEGLHCSDTTCDRQACPEDAGMTAEKEISLSQNSNPVTESSHIINPELAAAISQIHDFVLFLGKEAPAVQNPSPDGHGLSENFEDFSATLNKALCGNISLVEFVLDLSHVLSKASELSFNSLGYKATAAESISSDCIDKVALPESKVVQKDSVSERYPNGCSHSHISDSVSDPEVPHDGILVPGFELNSTPCKCSLEDFEQLKSEKENMAVDLARCTETLENTKSQLQETEQLLAEVKSQLGSAQRSNSLAETQLKCMAESYRSLEARAEEVEIEVNLLRVKTESLENELQEEKKNHHDALARCKDFEDQLQSSAADADRKTKEERELTAAAEKLAECQETIFLLGRQLKAMRPQQEHMGSPSSERSQKGEGFAEDEDEPTSSDMKLQYFDQLDMDTASSVNVHKAAGGGDSPMDLYNNSIYSPSDKEANLLLRSPISSKHPRHRPTNSDSSSSSGPTPEKQVRGFSRFFSSKGKNGH